MNNNMVLGQYYNTDSWIHKLDPRVKIISLLLLMIGLFLLDNIYILIGFFVSINILVISTKIPYLKFLNSLKSVSFLILFMFVFQVLFRKSDNIIASLDFTLTVWNLVMIIGLLIIFIVTIKLVKKFSIILLILFTIFAFLIQKYLVVGNVITSYNISISSEALISSFIVVLRIICILFLSSLLTLSTKPTDLNVAIERLLKPLRLIKINPSIFAMMISIALRFIPTLINEANKILKAQASRGVDFNEGKFKDKIMQIVSLIVPMFVIAYKRAIDLADAMEARGYDPDGKRSTLNELKFKGIDYFILVFMNILFASIIVLNIMYGI